MTIEIQREEKLNGSIIYCVYINSAYDTLFHSEEEAKIYVDKIKLNIKSGLPKIEKIYSEEI